MIVNRFFATLPCFGCDGSVPTFDSPDFAMEFAMKRFGNDPFNALGLFPIQALRGKLNEVAEVLQNAVTLWIDALQFKCHGPAVYHVPVQVPNSAAPREVDGLSVILALDGLTWPATYLSNGIPLRAPQVHAFQAFPVASAVADETDRFLRNLKVIIPAGSPVELLFYFLTNHDEILNLSQDAVRKTVTRLSHNHPDNNVAGCFAALTI